jgi:pimeloyl-ACP methyl ester carboxylesterase
MIFEQRGAVPVPVARLWDFMIDPMAVSACLPGVEAFSALDPDHYEGTVRIRLGPISLRLRGRLSVLSRDRESWTAQMSANAREHRMASGVEARMTVSLVPLGAAETELRVRTDAKILGKLGEFGQPIMRKTADRLLQQFVDNMIARLTAAEAGGTLSGGDRWPGIAALANGTISYLEQGAGPALVLLHGIGSAAQSWKGQLAALSGRYRVVAWDAPGYGQSSALSEPEPGPSRYAEVLRELLRERDIARCHLVGHSLGTLIAARFAADYPDLVQSLTLASVSTGHARLPEDERARLRQARLDDLATLGPDGMARKRGPRLVTSAAPEPVRQAVIDTMSRVRPDGYGQAVHMLSQGDSVADVLRLAAGMPVQFIFGSADVVTPPEQNRRVAAARPGAPVIEIPDAGHAVYLEQPERFNSALAAFLAEHA